MEIKIAWKSRRGSFVEKIKYNKIKGNKHFLFFALQRVLHFLT